MIQASYTINCWEKHGSNFTMLVGRYTTEETRQPFYQCIDELGKWRTRTFSLVIYWLTVYRMEDLPRLMAYNWMSAEGRWSHCLVDPIVSIYFPSSLSSSLWSPFFRIGSPLSFILHRYLLLLLSFSLYCYPPLLTHHELTSLTQAHLICFWLGNPVCFPWISVVENEV